MSDHVERACGRCGSLLHFADQCKVDDVGANAIGYESRSTEPTTRTPGDDDLRWARTLVDAATPGRWYLTPCNDGRSVNLNSDHPTSGSPPHFTSIDTRGRDNLDDLRAIAFWGTVGAQALALIDASIKDEPFCVEPVRAPLPLDDHNYKPCETCEGCLRAAAVDTYRKSVATYRSESERDERG